MHRYGSALVRLIMTKSCNSYHCSRIAVPGRAYRLSCEYLKASNAPVTNNSKPDVLASSNLTESGDNRRVHEEYLQMLLKATQDTDPGKTQAQAEKVSSESSPVEADSGHPSFSELLQTLSQESYREKAYTDEYFQELVDSVKYSPTADTGDVNGLLADVHDNLPFDAVTMNTSNAIVNAVNNADQNLSGGEHCSDSSPNVQFKFDLNKLMTVRPLAPARAEGFQLYVNESKTLQQLLQLGIDLRLIYLFNRDIANRLLRMDMQRDLRPRLLWLKQLGLNGEQISHMLNYNAFLFTEPIEDMQVRVNYLKSKRFSTQCIARIAHETPLILTTPVKLLDKHLGYLQREFRLRGVVLF